MSILKTREEMQKSVLRLGHELTAKLTTFTTPDEAPPVFVCLGDNSIIFFADLIRKIEMDIHCEFIFSDAFAAASKGEIKFIKDLKDRAVIFVTDESGKDIGTFSEKIKTLAIIGGAKSAEIVSLG